MAGTDSSKTLETPAYAPVVILVRPQLGENIGMCARAMLNCGVTELRIVAPRDGWPNPAAVSAASGAVSVIENARIFATTAEAVADLQMVLATTARTRDLQKTILSAEEAGVEIRRVNSTLGKAACGLMFGPERTGLENDDIALATTLVTIPLNPAFSSLNLAQATLLLCYSWLVADNHFDQPPAEDSEISPPASSGQIENFLNQMESELEDAGFFRSEAHRPTLLRNIRNYFFRSQPTEQEVRTLHGIVATLGGKRRRRAD